RGPYEQAVGGEPGARRGRLVGGDGLAGGDQRLSENSRDDVRGAAEGLEAFDAGKDLGDDRDDLDAGVVLFQAAARAREGSAGADADDEMGETTTGLLENLRRRRLVVGAPVVVVAVLVAEEVAVGVGL